MVSTYDMRPVVAPRRRERAATALRTVERRRALQLALAALWLVDAALQYQPSMFSSRFVTRTLETATIDAPAAVARPALWVDHLLAPHILAWNGLFATTQLVIAISIAYRPTLRIGLAASMGWGLVVWWLAEGIGGITVGASPLMGAPGAALLYVIISALVWPCREDRPAGGPSVAEGGPLGRWAPRATWAALWALFAVLILERANRAPSATHDMVQGMAAAEPGWIATMDRGLAVPLAHHGTEVAAVLAVAFALVALGGPVLALRRPAVMLAVALGVVIWVLEDFGGILTGSGTDVNSGPLLVLLAATYWPAFARRRPAPADAV
jgi:hypothetical protein